MASSDVDLKQLGRVAVAIERKNPLLAASLRQIEGNSIMLAPRLYRARKMRKLDTSRDTKSLSNYQHILWLAREGLSVLEVDVLPYTQHGQYGAVAAVLTSKLRASFLHIFALFHNQPPVATRSPSSSTSTAPAVNPPASAPSNGRGHRYSTSRGSNNSDPHTPPRANQSKPKDGGRTTGLRDPVGSITSETSFVTNPYAGNPAKSSAGAVQSPQPPPGLPGLPSTPRPSAFILPPLNFLPMAESYFINASRIAAAYLPGSHPLRLSVEVEHCAFIWDCLHDHQYARRLARHTIREVYHAKEGMEDEDFDDAAKMVDHLGKVMKRKSVESTPKMVGSASPLGAKDASPVTKQEWMDREARAVGGGLRGVAHVQGQLVRIHESLNPFETTGSLKDLPDLALAEDLLEEMGGYDGNAAPAEDEDENEDWSLRYHPNSFKMRKIGGPARHFPNTVVDYELVPRYDEAMVAQLLRAAAPSDEDFIAERIILRGGGPVDLPDVPASPAIFAAARANAAAHAPAARGSEELPEYDWSPRVRRRGGDRLKPAVFVADLRIKAELSAAAPSAGGAPLGAPRILLAEAQEEERRSGWEEEMEKLEAEIRLEMEVQEMEVQEMEVQEMGVWEEDLVGGKVVDLGEEEEILLRQEIEAEMAEQEMGMVEMGVVEAVWREIGALKKRGVMPCSFSAPSMLSE